MNHSHYSPFSEIYRKYPVAFVRRFCLFVLDLLEIKKPVSLLDAVKAASSALAVKPQSPCGEK